MYFTYDIIIPLFTDHHMLFITGHILTLALRVSRGAWLKQTRTVQLSLLLHPVQSMHSALGKGARSLKLPTH